MPSLTQTLKDYIYTSQLASPSLCCEAWRVLRTPCVLRFKMVGRRLNGDHVENAPSSVHSISIVCVCIPALLTISVCVVAKHCNTMQTQNQQRSQVHHLHGENWCA